ncbi:MAG: DUF4132 domain-containing protein [Armatimonadetes bacterium]|nr:DUF4132 domain-containing protein [Armatimonadota bacterium]
MNLLNKITARPRALALLERFNRLWDETAYRRVVLAEPPEVQEALAGIVIEQSRYPHVRVAMTWFPWGLAQITDAKFLTLWNYCRTHDYYFEGLVRHIKERLPRVTEAEGKRFLTEVIGQIEARSRENGHSHPLLHTFTQLRDGTMAVIEPWQAPVFAATEVADLVAYAITAKGATPSERWLKKLEPLAQAADAAAFRAAVEASLDAMVTMPASVVPLISDQARGLMLAMASWPDEATAKTLGRALRVTGDKIPGVGARCLKGFRGALWSLAQHNTFDALAQMSLAKAKLKVPMLAGEVEFALNVAASRQGITIEELEERIVPDFGLDEVGELRVGLGTDHAVLRLDAMARSSIHWFSGAKEVASATKSMKADFKEEIDTLRRLKKDLDASVSAQKRRIDRMLLSRRRIPFKQWKESYLGHPVVARLARRLVWDLRAGDDTVLALPLGGVLQQADGKPVTIDEERTTVSLWHPIDSTDAEVRAWRDALFTWEVTQPFKQAFREIYVLTPAEERTRTYSNRYAAQIIRQHQAIALMRDRGWKAKLTGFFDNDMSNPRRNLDEWELAVEFFIDIAGEQMTDAGIATYVATDQVRFLRANQAVPLADIPGIVFSEIFRDVDLFVGVASIGNDPEWSDQGEREVFNRNVWHESSFGDLGAQAETRKEVLARLLPRLKIGKVAEIDGRFLRVTGKRHTYKIHLGSGNILIAPQDRYLCIVPGGKDGTGEVFLPFEGDRTLAIILSKASMLAEDDKIKDQTILRQL